MQKLNTKAFALAAGLLRGFGVLSMARISMTGYGEIFISIIGRLYLKVDSSRLGGIIGFIRGFIDAYIGAFIFALLYNMFTKKFKK